MKAGQSKKKKGTSATRKRFVDAHNRVDYLIAYIEAARLCATNSLQALESRGRGAAHFREGLLCYPARFLVRHALELAIKHCAGDYAKAHDLQQIVEIDQCRPFTQLWEKYKKVDLFSNGNSVVDINNTMTRYPESGYNKPHNVPESEEWPYSTFAIHNEKERSKTVEIMRDILVDLDTLEKTHSTIMRQ